MATNLEAPKELSSTDKYRNEWEALLSCLENNFNDLRNLAFAGELKVSKFRSICWALLLRVVSGSPTNWVEQKKQQRQKYEKLKDEFACNPHKQSGVNDDPLSQSEQSIWNQYFGDQELFSVIKQDVVRTFPGIDFFRKPLIQEAMINVLFYYAREHPYMCYRQGMHEILAPIIFVIHCDHQALLHFKEITKEIDENLLNVLDPVYLAPDSYAIFSRVMSSIESYYRISNLAPTSEGYFPVQTECFDDIAPVPEVEVISQLNFIKERILAKEDLHLHNHLLKLDIPLHIFGIRWLRLLFGREFPLQDLLILWDAIFADSDKFELPNYILVAMLIRIRDKLLLSDYTTCLTHLMKYPNNVDVSLILKHALHMQNPKNYERPVGAFIYVTTKYGSTDISPNNYSSSPQRTSGKLHNTLIKPNGTTEKPHSVRPSSLIKEDRKILSDFSEIQYTNAMNAAKLANYTAAQGADATIIDGYRVDSPQILRLELQNAQTILTISRLKLKKYLETLRAHVTKSQSDELNQAIDGIEELCAFLDVKFTTQTNPTSHRVDPALEADEACQTDKKTKRVSNNFKGKRMIKSDKPLDTKSYSVGSEAYEVGDNLSTDFSRQQEGITMLGTRYEIPDNNFTNKVFTGSMKEFELQLFREQRIKCNELCDVPIPDPVGTREK